MHVLANHFATRFSRVAFAAALATVGLSSAVPAGASDADRPCSNRTLRGDYGVLFSGTLLGQPTVGTAIRTYDGKGGFVQIDNEHSYFATVRDRRAEGTYTVLPNCTGTMTLVLPQATIESAFVIVQYGDEIKEAVMSPDAAFVTGTQTRVR